MLLVVAGRQTMRFMLSLFAASVCIAFMGIDLLLCRNCRFCHASMWVKGCDLVAKVCFG